MTGCALCSIDYPGDRYLIRLKPRCAGVRILTLDGGGVRGIIELALLQAVHQAIGLGDSLPLRAFFDLIVGTSTGEFFPTFTQLSSVPSLIIGSRLNLN